MESMNEQKSWAIDRIEKLLEKLKEATNPFDIEAKTYLIKITAENAYKKMHGMNSEVLS